MAFIIQNTEYDEEEGDITLYLLNFSASLERDFHEMVPDKIRAAIIEDVDAARAICLYLNQLHNPESAFKVVRVSD